MCANKSPESDKKIMITQHSGGGAGKPSVPQLHNGLEPELQDHIGRQLRAVYNEIVNEPVPDRFLQLLAELERKQADKS